MKGEVKVTQVRAYGIMSESLRAADDRVRVCLQEKTGKRSNLKSPIVSLEKLNLQAERALYLLFSLFFHFFL